MKSRMPMTASAAVMGAIGLVLTFAPQEILAYFSQPKSNALPVMLQLAGALYLGFAFTNWTARGAVLGGIYGRAIILGNFLQFTMGALALLKMSGGAASSWPSWAALGLYALFAVLFGRLLFGASPVGKDLRANSSKN